MAKNKSGLLFATLGAFLIAGSLTYVVTGLKTKSVDPLRATANDRRWVLVDETPMQTALLLQNLTSTGEEQQQAVKTIRVADHVVDQAFASALREAHQRTSIPTGETVALSQKIQELQTKIQSDQERMRKIEPPKGQDETNVGVKNESGPLEIANAQLRLDQGELEAAQSELNRANGDPIRLIQKQLSDYMERGKIRDSAAIVPKAATFRVSGVTLWSHLEDAWVLRRKMQGVSDARTWAFHEGARLTQAAYELKRAQDAETAAAGRVDKRGGQSSASTDEAANVRAVERQGAMVEISNIQQDRLRSLRDLAEEYADWQTVIRGQIRVVLHAIVGSVVLIIAIATVWLFALQIVDSLYEHREDSDRRLRATRVSYRVGTHVLGAVLILLALFGVPSQVATVLALAGAGLTVVLKDYVVGFFGWFTLMGHNGIRVGDWIEINGICGEVIEIGLVKTVLLETGNWNEEGHPTGRKVSFGNSFAIEGHYFNFTTSGQWLWDELEVPVPNSSEPEAFADAIRVIVEKETTAYAAPAEKEWKVAMSQAVAGALSAVPAVELRPSGSGMNVVVRYVSQASRRQDLRSQLYRVIVASLYGKGPRGEKC
jgi:small-conductance mechanosensitive channel